MERLKIAEHCQHFILGRRTMMMNDEDVLPGSRGDFDGLSYQPKKDCPKCAGAGFYHPLNAAGKVNYAITVPCDHPGCYAQQAQAYKTSGQISSSGVIGSMQSFENFNADVSGVKKAYKAAWQIAEFGHEFNWLLIYGGVGNGKTHLLNAIANKVMADGIPTRLIMMAELLSELRMAISNNKVDHIMKELKEIPYLLIDELGLEYGTEWEKEKIEELLASRWVNARVTVVATNRDIEDLPLRLRSRFKDRMLSRCVINEAVDYRGNKRKV